MYSRLFRLIAWFIGMFVLSGILIAPVGAYPPALPGQPQQAETELLGARTDSSRTFRRADGSLVTRIFAEPIAYPAADGSFALIDSALVADGATLHPRASNFPITLQRTLATGEPFLTFADPQQTVTLQPLNLHAQAGEVADSIMTFHQVAPALDLTARVGARRVGLAFSLQRAGSVAQLAFAVTTSGSAPTVAADGTLTFGPCTTNCLRLLPPLLDDAGGALSDGVKTTLTERGDGRFIVTYALPAVWLTAPERVFPVTATPELATGNPYALYVQEHSPATSSCNAQRMLPVGYDPPEDLSGNGKLKTRTYAFFDLNALPPAAVINSAALFMYRYYLPPGAAGFTAEVHRVTSNWTNNCIGTTWNQQPTFDSAVAASLSVNTVREWKTWDVTSMVRQWTTGTPNEGLMIAGNPESQIGVIFCSNVAAGTQCGSNSEQLHPYIEVGYTANQPPNPPQLLGPANGGTSAVAALTLSWQDMGDPDNQPRTYRDFNVEIRKSDNSWSVKSGWVVASSWGVTVPGNGTYLWRVQAGDGAVGSTWTSEWSVNVTTSSDRTLNVRYADQVYVQQKPENGYWNHCGPASTAMILFYEKKEQRDVLYDRQATLDLVCQVKPNCSGGSYAYMIVNALQRKGLTATFKWSPTFNDLKQSIQNGHAVIMSLQGVSHLVAVTGFRDDGTIIINDPFGGFQWWNKKGKRNTPAGSTPKLNGLGIAYRYGSELTGRYAIYISGPAPAAQTMIAQGSAHLATQQNSDQLTISLPPALATANLRLTYTPLITPSVAMKEPGMALQLFTLRVADEHTVLDQFSAPVTLTMNVPAALIDTLESPTEFIADDEPSVVSPATTPMRRPVTLRVVRWDDTQGQWISLVQQYDRASGLLQVQTDQPGEFALLVSQAANIIYLPLIAQ